MCVQTNKARRILEFGGSELTCAPLLDEHNVLAFWCLPVIWKWQNLPKAFASWYVSISFHSFSLIAPTIKHSVCNWDSLVWKSDRRGFSLLACSWSQNGNIRFVTSLRTEKEREPVLMGNVVSSSLRQVCSRQAKQYFHPSTTHSF